MKESVFDLAIIGGGINGCGIARDAVLERLAPYLPHRGKNWTETHPLPGGDFSPDEFESVVRRLQAAYPVIEEKLAVHLVGMYETGAHAVLGNVKNTPVISGSVSVIVSMKERFAI